MGFRRRRIVHDVLAPYVDGAVEIFLPSIDPREDRRGGEQLEGAAQGKPLVAAVRGLKARTRVDNRDAEPPASLLLDLREPAFERAGSTIGRAEPAPGHDRACRSTADAPVASSRRVIMAPLDAVEGTGRSSRTGYLYSTFMIS